MSDSDDATYLHYDYPSVGAGPHTAEVTFPGTDLASFDWVELHVRGRIGTSSDYGPDVWNRIIRVEVVDAVDDVIDNESGSNMVGSWSAGPDEYSEGWQLVQIDPSSDPTSGITAVIHFSSIGSSVFDQRITEMWLECVTGEADAGGDQVLPGADLIVPGFAGETILVDLDGAPRRLRPVTFGGIDAQQIPLWASGQAIHYDGSSLYQVRTDMRGWQSINQSPQLASSDADFFNYSLLSGTSSAFFFGAATIDGDDHVLMREFGPDAQPLGPVVDLGVISYAEDADFATWPTSGGQVGRKLYYSGQQAGAADNGPYWFSEGSWMVDLDAGTMTKIDRTEVDSWLAANDGYVCTMAPAPDETLWWLVSCYPYPAIFDETGHFPAEWGLLHTDADGVILSTHAFYEANDWFQVELGGITVGADGTVYPWVDQRLDDGTEYNSVWALTPTELEAAGEFVEITVGHQVTRGGTFATGSFVNFVIGPAPVPDIRTSTNPARLRWF